MKQNAPDPMLFAVCALGLTQITAWGTSYYCLGVLAKPIAADLGWTSGLVYAGFTVALLVMGAISPWAGRMVDRHGGQRVMTAGTVLVSLGLLLLSMAYLAVWAFMGFGMRLCLYDAAFAALVQVTPSRGRMAISYLTLFGAFASTVFWVVGHYLNEAMGWRQTLMVFAAINLAVCLPLNWFGLARREESAPAQDAAAAGAQSSSPLEGRARSIGIALFAGVMSLNAFTFGVITVQLVQLLEAAGLAAAAAVWMASMKGFAQFGGRVVEIVFGRRLHAMTVARIAVGGLPLSLMILLLAGGNLYALLAFTLLMGASQGVISIVRGAVPLAIFGPTGYGAVLGLIATPVMIMNAAAPTAFAMIVDAWGWGTGQLVLLAAALLACAAMESMSAWYRTQHK
jgi:predicted MFS family arabinose efflux permease